MSRINGVMNPRVGIVGCGTIGRTHLNAYRANGVRPVAVADASIESVKSMAEQSGARPYVRYKEMLASEELDVVSVCTPPALHCEITLAALDAGAAVLCEKPMALTVGECELMAGAARRQGKLLTVGFCHRFQPQIVALRKMVECGQLGTVMMFRNRFAGYMPSVENTWFSRPEISGGGVIFDTCIHSVDLFRYLIGNVDQVRALTSTTETDLGPALEVEDSAIITLKSTSGALGVIEASWRTQPGEWTVSVYGTAGSAIFDYDSGELRVRMADEPGWKAVEVLEGNRFELEIANFLECLRGEAAPRVTVEDGIEATRLLAASYESAQLPTIPGT